MGVGMWALCFIHAGFELCDYAYAVVCDRLPREVLRSTEEQFRRGGGGGCFTVD